MKRHTVNIIGCLLIYFVLSHLTSSHATELSDFDKLYLTRRPPHGDIFVVDIAGESLERKILAATLQGVVNKKEARIYILDGGDAGKTRPWEKEGERTSSEFWLGYYQKKYGIKKKWEGKLDESLRKFSSEIKGYILVSFDEPWTINAGTTLAALKGDRIIAFETEKKLLEDLNIPLTETLTGKWKDAVECYRDMYEKFYDKMPHKGFAILAPNEYRLRDFLIQQGIFTLYVRPAHKEWNAIKELIQKFPQNIPVFGYVADTGDEEVVAVQALSQSGKYLIPTDTTPNFSFHVSVVPKTPYKQKPQKKSAAKNPCDNDKLNVTIAISDGDNLVIPVTRYAWHSFWNSEKRGKLPVGWSMGLGLGALAPAIMDYYFSTATQNDEWVAMLGIGYTQVYYYADRKFFLTKTYSRMRELGLTTQWILDFPLSNPKARAWSDFSAYAVDGHPSGVLLGYGGIVFYRQFRTKKGMPVLIAINNYTDTPEMLAAHLRKLLEDPPGAKPRLVFINATAWLNPVEKLVEILSPLQNEGVNFLLPSDALRCVP